MQGFKLLLYGFTKVGKTTTAASFPNATFVTFERGHKYLRPQPRKLVELWPNAEGWDSLRAFEMGPARDDTPETLVIDSASGMWDACTAYICRENKGRSGERPASHIGEIGDKGKGWDLAKAELASQVFRLIQMCERRMLVFVAHARIVEVDRIALKHQRIEVDLVKTAFGVFDKLVNAIWYLGYNTHLDITAMKGPAQTKAVTTATKDRVLWCRGSETLLAGGHERAWPDSFDSFDGARGFITLTSYVATHLKDFGLAE